MATPEVLLLRILDMGLLLGDDSGCGEETGLAITHTQSMDWPDLAEVIIITSSIAIDYTMEDRMAVAMEKAFLSPDQAP
uniref:Uncharacterized protein n=1 Tax=Oryza sativa subsp. japonica TaxID=39947 RepID=Q6K4D3_ORYSJ|nr:hypothetical protein [Oryza sativa Japonica Group]